MSERDRCCDLLRKVLDYYEGRKPFDFHRMPDSEQRAYAAFDTWQEIAGEIAAHLKSASEGRLS